MPFIATIQDPFALDNLTGCWAYCAEFSVKFSNKTGKVVFHIHKTKEAAYADKPPIKEIIFELTPTGRPAEYGVRPLISPEIPYKPPVYGSRPLITPEVPPVYQLDAENNPVLDENGNPIVITPGVPAVYGDAPILVPEIPHVPAVYGDAPLIRAAVPSFDELVAANQMAYGLLRVAVDNLALSQPEFVGSIIEA